MQHMHLASALELNARCATVEQVVAAWPSGHPLVMLHSAETHDRWGRWSVLASPTDTMIVRPSEGDPIIQLKHLLASPQVPACDVPFVGGWIGYLSYELGNSIEPASRFQRRQKDRATSWPLIELAYCPSVLVHDHLRGRWHSVGHGHHGIQLDDHADDTTWRAGDLTSGRSADAHLDAVSRTLDYIAAGDIFQANMTQQFSAPFCGSTRTLANHALQQSGARYGAYLELPDGRCVLSMSPELFLQFDERSRTVTTRPIKGTRPQSSDPRELLESGKDEAELNMIIDLMRNDLGRVCEYGTVRVDEARCIETYPTVHHGVSTIRGRLCNSVSVADLIAATFPAGSITGAPKIRAMQIIEELEDGPRGPYCGSVGMFSHCGNMTLNVAIRTMLLRGTRPKGRWDQLDGELTYGAGGGIVADSQPLAEYRESLDKAAVLRMALTPNASQSHALYAD